MPFRDSYCCIQNAICPSPHGRAKSQTQSCEALNLSKSLRAIVPRCAEKARIAICAARVSLGPFLGRRTITHPSQGSVHDLWPTLLRFSDGALGFSSARRQMPMMDQRLADPTKTVGEGVKGP